MKEVRWAGIDVGSTATKAVVIDPKGGIVGSHVMPSGTDLAKAAEDALTWAMEAAGGPELGGIIATGYGRENAESADRTVTEITCHGRGAHHHFPEAITVVDIGGQDTKVICLEATGRRKGFRMNRKCSAGTGVFLEEISRRLDIPMGDLDTVARRSDHAAPLSSYCTVFASTEMLSRIRAGEPAEELVRGAFESVVRRVMEMADLRGTVVLTGGVVAHHPLVAEVLAKMSGADVNVPPEPQLIGALGAALIAKDED
jgi:predicted CoA-substrate-specific enzyme activase